MKRLWWQNDHQYTVARISVEVAANGGIARSKEISYPNVAPEPSIYFPRVRITPLGPAPYWKMVTVPKA
jgi:hypothetical protein